MTNNSSPDYLGRIQCQLCPPTCMNVRDHRLRDMRMPVVFLALEGTVLQQLRDLAVSSPKSSIAQYERSVVYGG